MLDPTAPDVNAPPRQVYEWTVVPGHEVLVARRAADGVLIGRCSCDKRQGGVSGDWREEHSADAWLTPVSRDADESIESWLVRVLAVLAEARVEDERRSDDLAARMAVKPGEAYTVITEDDLETGQRVEVLQHQLAGPPFKELA